MSRRLENFRASTARFGLARTLVTHVEARSSGTVSTRATRWKASQRVVQELTGENVPRIFDIDVLNFASLAANRRAGFTTGTLRQHSRF
jgi:hypothetical protein